MILNLKVGSCEGAQLTFGPKAMPSGLHANLVPTVPLGEMPTTLNNSADAVDGVQRSEVIVLFVSHVIVAGPA